MTRTKKNFDAINTDRVYNAIAEATAEPEQEQEINEAQESQAIQDDPHKRKERRTYTKEEVQAFKEEMRTAGRKGVKLPRINLAFSPTLYDYVQTMSRVRGESMTDFVNCVLRQSMDDHADLYQKAKDLLNSF